MEPIIMEPRQRACMEQFVILLEFMERNGDLARPQGQTIQGRLKTELLWQALSALLNSVEGGTQKPLEKWKKAWADWKTKTKKKASQRRITVSGTGGRPSQRVKLTTLEERVLKIMGRRAVRPIIIPPPPAPESGTNRTEDVRTIRESPPPPSPSPSPPPASAAPSEQSTPRIRVLPVRRRRAITTFERVAIEFVAVERARLKMEEVRDRRLHEREVERERLLHERERMLHERELERLRVEAQRVAMERERNVLLRNLADIPQLLTRLLEQLKQ